MSEPATLEEKDGHGLIRGAVTLHNVQSLLVQGSRLTGERELHLDFSGVSEADSSAVALMLAWTREAAARGQGIVFENCPASLRTLISLYDVGEYLPCR